MKALSFVAGPGRGTARPRLRLHHLRRGRRSARGRLRAGRITDPRTELAMAEVHDCFTPTELVLMEDLGFSERGLGWKDVLAGAFDLDGDLPVNPDGGLKSLRPPDRRVGPADALRVLAATAAGGRRPADRDRRRGTDQGADPESRRRSPVRASASYPSSAPNSTRAEGEKMFKGA